MRPAVLWKMRGPIVGLGGAQVLGTAGAVAVLAIWLGLRWQMAVTVGLRLRVAAFKGVTDVYRETFGSAVDLSVRALGTLGLDGERARRAAQIFREHDEASVREMAQFKTATTQPTSRSRACASRISSGRWHPIGRCSTTLWPRIRSKLGS